MKKIADDPSKKASESMKEENAHPSFFAWRSALPKEWNVIRSARWAAMALFAMLMLVLAVRFLPSPLQPPSALAGGVKVNEGKDVIGDLGGVPVKIPKAYAHLVEYDGDPHFTQPRTQPAPERTYASKISGFAFEIYFPDMQPKEDFFASNKGGRGNLLSVSINSGGNYGTSGDDSLENHVKRITQPRGHKYQYKPLPNTTHDLIGYEPIGVDISRRILGERGADISDRNIYYYRDASGRVATYIECSNMTHNAALCKQRFNLKPQMRAHVSVLYRKEYLPQWREIQSSVSEVIYGFRAN